MREIKFRGKRIEDGKWIYGYYADLYGCPRIIRENDKGELKFSSRKTASPFRSLDGLYIAEAVDPETVGQYTGFKDQNGNEVYEGDVLMVREELCRVQTGICIDYYVKIIWMKDGWGYKVIENGNPYGPIVGSKFKGIEDIVQCGKVVDYKDIEMEW